MQKYSDISIHGGYEQGNSSQQWMYGEGNGGSDYKWSQPTQWKFNKEKGKNFFLPRFFGSIFRLSLIIPAFILYANIKYTEMEPGAWSQ